jgi:hypothetical protein
LKVDVALDRMYAAHLHLSSSALPNLCATLALGTLTMSKICTGAELFA